MLSKYLNTSRISSRLVSLKKNNLSKDFRLSSRLAFLTKGNLCKRSQIPAQIFIYIIAIILFSFILLYGYNAIKGFKERSELITYIKFKTDLISTVKRISTDYGTLEREEFFLGGEYRKVCFVQSYNPPNDIGGRVTDMIVKNSVEDGVNKNTFLFTTTLQESPFDVGKINVSDGYLCINMTNGKAKIQFEGKGNHAFISGWG